MGHIGVKVSTNGVSDGFHARVVDEPGVGGRASDDDARSVELGKGFELVVVNDTCGFVEAVGKGFKVFRYHGYLLGRSLVAMGKMAAMGQVETHDSVMGVENSRVGVEVGWRAR